jgi:Uma2 family endonuclease
MSTLTTLARPPERIVNDPSSLHRFTVAEYHHLVESGILTPADRAELLEGWIVNKMSQNPPHASTLRRIRRRIDKLLPADWTLCVQAPITLSESEPEPDITLARGDEDQYDTRHPEPGDIGLLIEVADSSVMSDRRYKGELYARAKVPVFWLVNLDSRKIEVYTRPRGGKYQKQVEHTEEQAVPLLLDGVKIADIPVSELMAPA